nr:non-reducing end alpha-L-arabinofuranosidase family hydrolase [Streptomyces griseus]
MYQTGNARTPPAQGSNRYALFEASNMFKIQGSSEYLLLVEAIGSDGRRYFCS